MFQNTTSRPKVLLHGAVVAFVVAVFVALLLPAASRCPGRRNFRHVKDASNIRGILQANILWAQGYPSADSCATDPGAPTTPTTEASPSGAPGKQDAAEGDAEEAGSEPPR